jgi:hypothetical protein
MIFVGKPIHWARKIQLVPSAANLALVNASAHKDLAARQASFDLLVITVAQ